LILEGIIYFFKKQKTKERKKKENTISNMQQQRGPLENWMGWANGSFSCNCLTVLVHTHKQHGIKKKFFSISQHL
jgi:hypothetical protein